MEPDGRALMVEYLQSQLVGPVAGDEEELREPPTQRYLMGTLYPQGVEAEREQEGDIQDDTGAHIGRGQHGEDMGDDPIALANTKMPSCLGLSFLVSGTPVLEIRIRAAVYVKDGQRWRRRALGPLTGEELTVEASQTGSALTVLDGRAALRAVFRPFGSATLITVALVNVAEQADRHKGADPGLCLFQTELSCRTTSGRIAPYPTADRIHIDPEDEELSLLYRRLPTWAIGHGCSATWTGEGAAVDEVATTFMPSEVLPDVVYDIDPAEGGGTFTDIRSLGLLQRADERPQETLAGLRDFVAAYRTWIGGLPALHRDVPERLIPARDRLLARLERAATRMADGVDTLEDPVTMRAFALANRAMLMQMRHSSEDYGGHRRKRNERPFVAPDYEATGSESWRPFQLAFVLLTLESVVNDESDDRDTVDLIWFPTGGGKTEAYLLLAAFQIFLRRLRHRDAGAGTTIITRYTLRLLTSQQFRRASALICACEMLRSRDPMALGSRAITIGIWVGGDTSPNSFADAVKLKEALVDGEQPGKGFQLELCPWCGTEIVPGDREDTEGWGVHPRNDSCHFSCPSDACPFHLRLPIEAVDAALYAEPPTLLIATVDKFARMPWVEEAGVFLGTGGDPGPSLIIQDELHLISGPLGTLVALYEAAFDLVMKRKGLHPKVVASTATIRRAERQVEGVFGRRVLLFPPAGLAAERSYFVRFDPSRPGRRYVGIMAQSHTPTTAMVHVSAAMLQGPMEIKLSDDERDRFWTLVAYHNSLRELGKTVTLARDDIPDRIKVIASTEDVQRALEPENLAELTSNIPAAQIPQNLELLERRVDDPEVIDFVACTNMLSVGVDVQRLGLMVVVGQPKSTSEYIQASSRVGRGGPGLIVALYSSAKPRDRSHYESFRTYHSALYRQVEPTSVTPFSLPARERALHAAVVVLARHALGFGGDDAAALVDPHDAPVKRLLEELIERVRISDPDETDATVTHLERILGEWDVFRSEAARRSGGLRYAGAGKSHVALLRRFGAPGDGWETLDSMRNVDLATPVKIRGQYS